VTKEQLFENIKRKKSFLCVGLDTDLRLIPKHLLKSEDPVFEFNKQIIDATKDLCIAYKPNTAFYETLGAEGWISLEKTINYINETCKDIFTIADAKRGDIGNTSKMYAKTFLEKLNFDSITVAPYMGEDSIRPFLEFKNKWAIVLGLTSNAGAKDFELQKTGEEFLYEKVLKTISQWGTPENLVFVVGATQADEFINIRKIIPEHFLLVPGVGSQGGSLKDISEKAMTKDCGILVNVSRAIIYASEEMDFAEKAKEVSLQYQSEMKLHLKK
jgi:orotidine-5'-phosphate decarboxylase